MQSSSLIATNELKSNLVVSTGKLSASETRGLAEPLLLILPVVPSDPVDPSLSSIAAVPCGPDWPERPCGPAEPIQATKAIIARLETISAKVAPLPLMSFFYPFPKF